MLSLEYLDVSKNKIKRLKDFRPAEFPNLKVLLMQRNCITFKERAEFHQWLERLSSLELLQEFDYSKNRFLLSRQWGELMEREVEILPESEEDDEDIEKSEKDSHSHSGSESIGSDESLEKEWKPVIFPFHIIRRCKNLETINGESRRDIKRCMKAIYAGKECHHKARSKEDEDKISKIDCQYAEDNSSDDSYTRQVKAAKRDYYIKHCDSGSEHSSDDEKSKSKSLSASAPGKEADKSKQKQQKKRKKKLKEPPRLEVLHHYFEQLLYAKTPSATNLCKQQEDTAKEAINTCVNALSDCKEWYGSENDRRKHLIDPLLTQTKGEEEIEAFCQLVIQVLDKGERLYEDVLEHLCKLVFLDEYYKFGHRIFDCLMDIMSNSKDLENLVEDSIHEFIIKKIVRGTQLYQYPAILFEDLADFIAKEKSYRNYLKHLYDEGCLTEWIEGITDDIQNYNHEDKIAHNDAIVKLLSVSVSDTTKEQNKCIQEFEDAGMCDEVYTIFKNCQPEDERYQYCLECIESLANNDEDLAEQFFLMKMTMDDGEKDPGFSALLAEKIEVVIDRYLELTDEEIKDSNLTAENMLIYERLKIEMKAFGGLMNCESNDEVIKKNCELIYKVMCIIGQPVNDPIVLQAACTFAKDLFETDELMNKENLPERVNHEGDKKFEDFYEALQDLRECIPYLGGAKYRDLLKMTRRYNEFKEATKVQQYKLDGSDATGKTTHMQERDMSTVNQDNADKLDEAQRIQSLENLDDELVCTLFESIINLLQHFSLHGFLGTNERFDEISERLNELGRDGALFNAMKIQNDAVKLAVVDCIYVVPMDEFEEDEISGIVGLLETYDDIDEGDAESVLATIFHTLTKFVLDEYDQPKAKHSQVFQDIYGQKAVDVGLKFLEINTTREVDLDDEDTDKEKYALSQAIVNFFKASTNSEYMHNALRGREEEMKRILLNEEKFSTGRCYENPIDLETTLMGWSISSLMNMLADHESLTAYSPVSLRVIMSIADLLMSFYHCHSYDLLKNLRPPSDCKKDEEGFPDWIHKYVISDRDSKEKKIAQKQKFIIERRKQFEKDFIYDRPLNYIHDMSPEDKLAHHQHHNKFTRANGAGLLLQFLISRFPENEQMLFYVADSELRTNKPAHTREQVDDEILNLNRNAKIVSDKVPLRERIHEKQYVINQKIEKKYIDENQDLRKMGEQIKQRMKRKGHVKKSKNVAQSKDRKADLEGNSYSKASNRKQAIQDYKGHSIVAESKEVKLEKSYMDKKLLEVYQTIVEKREDEDWPPDDLKGTDAGKELDLPTQRGDGFQNRELRVLSVAAMLRCMVASIEFAPTQSLKNQAIHSMSSIETFRNISMLCDATDWDQEANIIPKYFRLARHILKLPLTADRETAERLDIYELIAAVCKLVMKKICDRMEDLKGADDEDETMRNLQNGIKMANYELTFTFYILVQQSQQIVFSNFDVVRLFREYEIHRRMVKKDAKHGNDTLMTMDQVLEVLRKVRDCGASYNNNFLNKDQKKFCEYMKSIPQQHQKGHLKIDDYLLKKKRTPQEKMVEYVILNLLEVDTVLQMLDTLFLDMATDYEIFKEVRDQEWELYQEKQLCGGIHNHAHQKESIESEEELDETISSRKKKSSYIETEPSSHRQHHESYIDSEDLLEVEDDDEESVFENDSDCDIGEARRFNRTPEIFVGRKNMLTIERIKEIVSELISTCPRHMQYDIMNHLMTGVIFKRNKLRTSFMQEILNTAKDAMYKSAIQKYINDNRLWASVYGKDPKDKEITPDGEDLIKMMRTKKHGYPLQMFQQLNERVQEFSPVSLNLTCLELFGVTHYGHKEDVLLTCEPAKGDDQETFDKKQRLRQEIEEENELWEERRFKAMKNANFVARFFAVTNQGIHVFRPLDKETHCHKCEEWEFCPRGPYQELCIRFTQIEKIITFPLVPQKFVIIYNCENIGQTGNEDGFCKMQLSVNVPELTSSSRIVNALVSNLEELRAYLMERPDWQWKKIAGLAKRVGKLASANQPLFEIQWGKVYAHYKDIVNLYAPDYMIEYDLRKIIEQLQNSTFDQWTEYQQHSMMEVCLIEVTLLDTNLVSEQFLDDRFKPDKKSRRKFKKDDEVLKSMLGNKYYKPENYKDDSQDLGKERRVFLFHYNNWLLLLREKWTKWEFVEDRNQLQQWMNNIDKMQQTFSKTMDISHAGPLGSELNKTAATHNSHQSGHSDHVMGAQNEVQEYMQEMANHIFSALYNIVLCIKLDNPLNWSLDAELHHQESIRIRQHMGAEASVRIMVGDQIKQDDDDEEKDKGPKNHYVDIEFPGDMERQQFIDQMWEKRKDRISGENDGFHKHSNQGKHDHSVYSLTSSQFVAPMSMHPLQKIYD